MTLSGAGGANSAGPQDGVDDADADALLAARLQAEEDALADAALAARLQLEERQSARARASAALAAAAGPSRQRQGNLAMQMRRRVEGALAHVQAFEDARNRSLALAAMPVERLRAEARAAAGDGAPEGATRDALLRSLAAWFKADFFRWFDAPRGADGAALPASAVSPTAEEAAHGARRVELYGDGTRFARYNDPAKLLETRVGRCGEWANCFCLCARALGFRVRHVHDWTDHVWAEVYSEARGGRWLHVDACENCVDEPLLYERGWGKRLSYVIALSTDGATDVSRRYVRPNTWEEVLGRRTHLMEPILQGMLRGLTARSRRRMSEAERARLALEDEREQEELALRLSGDFDAKQHEQQQGRPLPGRTTGSAEWRRARGELGSCDPEEGERE